MMDKQRLATPILAGILASGAAFAPVLADPVEIPTHQAMAGVELSLEMSELDSGRSLTMATTRSASAGPHPIRLGTAVVVCFTASQSGFITLWSVDENNVPARIYPNQLSHDDGDQLPGAPVAEGMRYCLGDDGRFRFSVGGTTGETYQLSLNWTPLEEDALPADAYVQIRGVRSAEPETSARFAATHLSYSPTN